MVSSRVVWSLGAEDRRGKHGKVHNPLQYRIHFEWPMPKDQKNLKVLFMGEKRTKR